MIRVTQVVYEPAHSGQSVHLLALAEYLDRERFDLSVCYPAGDAIMRRRLAELDVKGYPWPMRRWLNPGPAWALRRLVREDDIDIVHVHGQFAGLWARPAARFAGARVIYTPHTIRVRQRRLRRAYQATERFLGRLTHCIVSVSEADRRQLVAAGWATPEHIVTVPNGVDSELWQSRQVRKVDARRQLGWGQDAPIVLQIGRLDAQKAPDDFVRMAAEVLDERSDVRFYLAGDGPLQTQVEDQVRSLGLSESITLLGRRDDIPLLLSAADVITLTSLWEGMPYSLLEAGAAGRPAVCTAVDGSPEVVIDGETGYVTPAQKPAAMADAVMACWRIPGRWGGWGDGAGSGWGRILV